MRKVALFNGDAEAAAAALREPIERGGRVAVTLDGKLWGLGYGKRHKAAKRAGLALRDALIASGVRK